jgi:hypothetical protein
LLVRGIPPGIFPEVSYETATIRLSRGDSVIFVSDGLADAMNEREELFGMERLMEICQGMRGEGAEEILERMFGEAARFSEGHPQRDDRTAAVLEYKGWAASMRVGLRIGGGNCAPKPRLEHGGPGKPLDSGKDATRRGAKPSN